MGNGMCYAQHNAFFCPFSLFLWKWPSELRACDPKMVGGSNPHIR